MVIIENAVAYWAKVIGSPTPGYDEGSMEWSFDLAIDGATINGEPALDALKSMGLGSRIKNKGDEKGNFLHLKRNSVKKDGTPAKPIRVVDHHNEPWGDDLIGNGSIVNVSIATNEYGQGKNKKVTVRPIAIQVWDHVPYSGKNLGFKVKETSDEDTEGASDNW